MLTPFHLAFPVHDLEEARRFYVDLLGCHVGRSAEHWIDFDLYGHQIVAHLSPGRSPGEVDHSQVDGDAVPVPHFGVVLPMDAWTELRDRLLASSEVRWIIAPRVRFAGAPGEQATLFLLDPSGNALEFKAFADMQKLFASS